MLKHQSQVIALEKTRNAKVGEVAARVYRTFEQPALFAGISKTYSPLDEDGEPLPSESSHIRYKVADLLHEYKQALIEQYDLIATKDYTNCQAKADIIVDEQVVLPQVPATYLLFLEKRLEELAVFVKKIPTLDIADLWSYDAGQDCYLSQPIETVRTKKEKSFQIVVPQNDKFPAQVAEQVKDVREGTWRTIKSSGTIPARQKNAWLARIEKLQLAVKCAREEANRHPVQYQEVAEKLLSSIFE